MNTRAKKRQADMQEMQEGRDPRETESLDQLCAWGFQKVPANVSYHELAQFVKDGVPNEATLIYSNGDGYYKLLQQENNRVLLFDEMPNYGPESLSEINGEQFDLDSDEFYPLRCRVLFRVWDDVEQILPGKLQTDPDEFTWPDGEDESKFVGNTCLLKLKSKKGEKGTKNQQTRYRYVRGGLIAEFTLTEEVLDYFSFMANNTVPEPAILTQSYVYVPEANVRILRKDLPVELDVRNHFVRYFYDRDEDREDEEIDDWRTVWQDGEPDESEDAFLALRCGKCKHCTKRSNAKKTQKK